MGKRFESLLETSVNPIILQHLVMKYILMSGVHPLFKRLKSAAITALMIIPAILVST